MASYNDENRRPFTPTSQPQSDMITITAQRPAQHLYENDLLREEDLPQEYTPEPIDHSVRVQYFDQNGRRSTAFSSAARETRGPNGQFYLRGPQDGGGIQTTRSILQDWANNLDMRADAIYHEQVLREIYEALNEYVNTVEASRNDLRAELQQAQQRNNQLGDLLRFSQQSAIYFAQQQLQREAMIQAQQIRLAQVEEEQQRNAGDELRFLSRNAELEYRIAKIESGEQGELESEVAGAIAQTDKLQIRLDELDSQNDTLANLLIQKNDQVHAQTATIKTLQGETQRQGYEIGMLLAQKHEQTETIGALTGSIIPDEQANLAILINSLQNGITKRDVYITTMADNHQNRDAVFHEAMRQNQYLTSFMVQRDEQIESQRTTIKTLQRGIQKANSRIKQGRLLAEHVTDQISQRDETISCQADKIQKLRIRFENLKDKAQQNIADLWEEMEALELDVDRREKKIVELQEMLDEENDQERENTRTADMDEFLGKLEFQIYRVVAKRLAVAEKEGEDMEEMMEEKLQEKMVEGDDIKEMMEEKILEKMMEGEDMEERMEEKIQEMMMEDTEEEYDLVDTVEEYDLITVGDWSEEM